MPEDVKVISHVFLSVLIAGTLWRMVTFHLLASSNTSLAHLGKAMTVQYYEETTMANAAAGQGGQGGGQQRRCRVR